VDRIPNGNRLPLLAMATLGALFAAFFAGEVLPDTALGHAIQMAVFWIALYPVGRATFLTAVPPWRWWAAAAAGTVLAFALHTWMQPWSSEAHSRMGLFAVGLAILATLIWVVQLRTRHTRA
jgi:hypothetical protein